MAVDAVVRRRAKRGARSDDGPLEEPTAARAGEICEWCRQPGSERPSFCGLAAIRQDVFTHVSEMTLRHYTCAYSACVTCVQGTRTDLIDKFYAHFEHQAKIADVFESFYFVQPCPDANQEDGPGE